MIELDTVTLERIKTKLSRMANIFPSYELDDIRLLDNLLNTDKAFEKLTQENFFAVIDTTIMTPIIRTKC